MATTQTKLTAQEVRKIAAGEKRTDTDGLQIGRNKSGSLYFVYRYSLKGKRFEISCGGKDTTLAEARAQRDEFKRLVRKGVNPKQKRALVTNTLQTESEGGVTFGAVFEEYWSQVKHAEIGSEKDQRNWRNSVYIHFADLLPLPIADIKAAMIAEAMASNWLEINETLDRARQKAHQAFDYAVAREYVAADRRNPFDKDLVEKLLPSYEGIVTHHPAMEWPLIPQFYQNLSEAMAIGTAGPPVAVLAAEFAMLSVLRYQNVAGLRWEWISEAERYIAIPRALTKMGKNSKHYFLVPLTDPMIEVLNKARKLAQHTHANKPWAEAAMALVFPQEFQQEKTRLAGKPYGGISGNKIIAVIDACHPDGEHATTHGFRTSFKEWATEAGGVSDLVSERCLDHVDDDKTRAAYLRSDLYGLREEAMQKWADFITKAAD